MTGQRTHIDAPSWARAHPWTARTALAIRNRWADGHRDPCPHLPAGWAPGCLAVVDLQAHGIMCGPCWADHLATLPAAWTDGRVCDGCLERDALVTTVVAHAAVPGIVMLVGLCERCLPSGPVIA